MRGGTAGENEGSIGKGGILCQTSPKRQRVRLRRASRQGRGSRARKRQTKFAAAVFVLLFLLLAFDVRLKTVRYTVQSEKIGAPVRIALVTDLHSCSYGKGQRTLVDAIEKQKPDLLLLGGDIFDDGLPDRNTEIFLAAIAEQIPLLLCDRQP